MKDREVKNDLAETFIKLIVKKASSELGNFFASLKSRDLGLLTVI